MPRTPTPDELERYMDAVASGTSEDEAIAAVWPAVPDKATAMRQMVTEFPDGIVIGWDQCNVRNGGCGKHVSSCTCKDGPKEPEVFARWRQDATWPGGSLLPQITMPSKNPTGPTLSEEDLAAVKAGVAGGKAKGKAKSGTVRCVLSDHDVAADQADKNDDGTFACFACQEAGIQRPRVDA